MEEKRTFSIRASGDKEMYLEGYAIVFNSPATHSGMTEVIDRTALNGTIMGDVVLRYNHSEKQLIMARTRNNSLLFSVDDIGLRFIAKLIDTTICRDCYAHIKAGNLNQMSFAFTADKDETDYNTNTRRILHIEKLFDVSVVPTPYYEGTSVVARWADDSEDIATTFRKLRQKKIANELARKLFISEIEKKMAKK